MSKLIRNIPAFSKKIDFMQDAYNKYSLADIHINKKHIMLPNKTGMQRKVEICFNEEETDAAIDKISDCHPDYIQYVNKFYFNLNKGEILTTSLIYEEADQKKAVAIAFLAYVTELERNYSKTIQDQIFFSEILKSLSEFININSGIWHYQSRVLLPNIIPQEYPSTKSISTKNVSKFMEETAEYIKKFFDHAVFLQIISKPTEESEKKIRDLFNKALS